MGKNTNINEIIELYAAGYTRTDISKQLNIPANIVKEHMVLAGILQTEQDIANKVLLYKLAGYTSADISMNLRITKSKVDKIVPNINMLSNLNTNTLPDRSNKKINKLYKKGLDAYEISELLSLDISIVMHVISTISKRRRMKCKK